jgi:peptidoglycan glycosyltransferase
MNAQIRQVAVVGLVLLAALVVGTTYWQAWAVGDMRDRQDNAIQRVAEFRVKRGSIVGADGKVLAGNRVRRVDGQTYFFRRYPRHGLTAHVVGYSTQARSRTGLERSLNDYLTAANSNLTTVVDRTLDRLRGRTVTGNNLVLTIRPEAQQAALDALGTRCGAVVALEPSTGRVLVLASSPTYDPNLVERNFSAIERIKADCPNAAPLLNRATSGLYAPGSTFKVLTAAAALDSGKFTPDSTFYDPGYCIEYGKRVNNFDTSRPFGRITFTQALQHSVNSAFCEMGKRLGGLLLVDYMRRFGFYESPPLETPSSERRPSGLYRNGALFRPKQDFQVDPGRLAFGQERLGVTPLQMAMVTATIANDGVLMRPYVVERIEKPGGGVIRRTRPQELAQPISARTAHEVARMMELVVNAGTGTAARISGVRVAGKTGTAETGVEGRNTTWFVAFAPVERPRVAMAVMLEDQSGVGGTTAAPIAREVLEVLLSRRGT